MIKDKNYMFLFKLLMIYVLFYISFFFVFFFILGSNSVELVIAFGFIFLVVLIYFFFSSILTEYFMSVSKTIWMHFSNIILLLKLSKDLILNINKTYLMFLEYKTYVLYNVNYSLDYIFSEMILNLSEKFFTNNVYKLFYNKLILIYYSSEYLKNVSLLNNIGFYTDLMNIYSFYIILKKNG
jgi:hypothetical protein